MATSLEKRTTRYMARLRSQGFTVVELVGVLVIAGILLAVAMPRFFDHNAFDTRLFEDRVQAIFQYARKVAIAQNRNVFVQFNSTRIAVCFDSNCTSKVLAPGGSNSETSETKSMCSDSSWMCEGIPSSISYSASPSVTGIYFNALGTPFDTSNSSATAAILDISLTASGQTRHLYIEPGTGYVHP